MDQESKDFLIYKMFITVYLFTEYIYGGQRTASLWELVLSSCRSGVQIQVWQQSAFTH